MEKLTLGFIADILYIKGFIYFEEYEAILDAKVPSDLSDIVERMLRDEFSPYKRGETYLDYARK